MAMEEWSCDLAPEKSNLIVDVLDEEIEKGPKKQDDLFAPETEKYNPKEVLAGMFAINGFIATLLFASFEITSLEINWDEHWDGILKPLIIIILFVAIAKLFDEIFAETLEEININPDKITRIFALSPYMIAMVVDLVLNQLLY